MARYTNISPVLKVRAKNNAKHLFYYNGHAWEAWFFGPDDEKGVKVDDTEFSSADKAHAALEAYVGRRAVKMLADMAARQNTLDRATARAMQVRARDAEVRRG